MWEVLKVIGGLIILAGIVIGVLTTAFVFSWVFKIFGFIITVVVVIAIMGWCIAELVTGWWQDRKKK